MADYCTLADVRTVIPTLTLGDDSTPTETQAEAMVGMVGAELDGVLRSRSYSLPITDAEALAHLKTVQVYGSAALILKAAFPDDEGPGGDGGSAKFWADLYKEAKNALQSGALLIDAPLEESRIGEGFTTTSTGDAYVPRVTRETEW